MVYDDQDFFALGALCPKLHLVARLELGLLCSSTLIPVVCYDQGLDLLVHFDPSFTFRLAWYQIFPPFCCKPLPLLPLPWEST